jgi:Sulfotransferase family
VGRAALLVRDCVLHKPDLLIFLHMGKTGGTTLGDVLRRNFPEANQLGGWSNNSYSVLGLYPFLAIKECHDRLPRDSRRSIALLNGHVPFGVHEIFEQTAKYVTLVRTPADRAVSNFYYILENPAERFFYPHLKDMSFRDYVASDLCLDNSQVRALSGYPELGPQWDGNRPLISASVKPEHLQAAKRNIEQHFLAAAPLDDFIGMLLYLRMTFNWPLQAIRFTRKMSLRLGHPSPKSRLMLGR